MLSCIMQMRLRSSTRPVKGPETSSARASPARAVRARAIASILMRIDSKGGASHVPATAGTGRDAGQARDAGVGMPPMDDFDGRVAVITGGGGGIGTAMARAFAARGARIVLA